MNENWTKRFVKVSEPLSRKAGAQLNWVRFFLKGELQEAIDLQPIYLFLCSVAEAHQIVLFEKPRNFYCQ